MTDFARARRMMVDGQIRTNGVTDLRIIAAFAGVPREKFVPPRSQPLAYLDLDIPLDAAGGQGRRLIKPMVLAKLIQAAEIGEGDRVLDVGCATGYSSAILTALGAAVVALEEDPALARFAADALAAVGAQTVKVVTGSLVTGWPASAPYDVIVLNGATEVAPEPLLAQLDEGGRLVAVLGRAPIGAGTVYRRSGGRASAYAEFDSVAPLLPGFAKPAEFVF
jgi:protein-L-isoaspartate(D-aspartate) O-methyltransferase